MDEALLRHLGWLFVESHPEWEPLYDSDGPAFLTPGAALAFINWCQGRGLASRDRCDQMRRNLEQSFAKEDGDGLLRVR